MKRIFLPLLAPLLLAAGDPGATVQITVTGVANAKGHVLVAVCTRDEFLHPTCALHGAAPAQTGQVTIAIPNVPPGIYAVQAFHDENDNRIIDRNWIGMPTEAIGFSNDAKMRFGPPHFADAALQVGAQGGAVQVVLHRY